ncbi:MAG TPA: hypothetical protein VM537_34980 [Anaerolineae bacterium]|nr:hypothetical protein [Anaerolineae bacterium]
MEVTQAKLKKLLIHHKGSSQAVATALGWSRSRVYQRFLRMGGYAGLGLVSPQERKKCAMKLLRQGVPVVEIASALNFSEKSLRDFRTRAGICICRVCRKQCGRGKLYCDECKAALWENRKAQMREYSRGRYRAKAAED